MMKVTDEEIETGNVIVAEGARSEVRGASPPGPTPDTQHPAPDTRIPTPSEATEQDITRFAAAVAHELQQPLAVIRNAVYFLNIYMGEHLDEKVRKHMSMIWYSTDVAANSVADLLCFAEHKAPEPMDADVGILILDAQSRVRVPARITVKTIVHDTLPTINVDPMQVVRVMANLIANAVDSMPENGTLKIVGTADPRNVIVGISDTGVGISAEDLPRVFEPFFTTKPDGKGLGLAIVERLTKQNGGKIAVDSKPGRGTTVTLLFPWSRKSHGIGSAISLTSDIPEQEPGNPGSDHNGGNVK
jgi:signal transduction histidine kinase